MNMRQQCLLLVNLNPISHGVFDSDVIMGGGLKDPEPKTGLNLVRSL